MMIDGVTVTDEEQKLLDKFAMQAMPIAKEIWSDELTCDFSASIRFFSNCSYQIAVNMLRERRRVIRESV